MELVSLATHDHGDVVYVCHHTNSGRSYPGDHGTVGQDGARANHYSGDFFHHVRHPIKEYIRAVDAFVHESFAKCLALVFRSGIYYNYTELLAVFVRLRKHHLHDSTPRISHDNISIVYPSNTFPRNDFVGHLDSLVDEPVDHFQQLLFPFSQREIHWEIIDRILHVADCISHPRGHRPAIHSDESNDRLEHVHKVSFHLFSLVTFEISNRVLQST
mmetsp:Transcript_8446/g.16374  ORF Transcript_8446/g.16374 Transcript_8446/m.16374 type:complete len:216 (+) Transcript_8446:472-1119(+)